MARIFTDGAEFGDVLASGGFRRYIESSIVRSGNYSYWLNSQASTAPGVITFTLENTYSEFYFRAGINIYNVYSYISFFNGAAEIIRIHYNNDYTLTVSCGGTLATSTLTLSLSQWALIEFYYKFDSVSGRAILKVDNIIYIDFTGNTDNGSASSINILYFRARGTYNGRMYIDDIAFNDTTGSENNSWCGDGKIILLTPNADGDSSDFINTDGDSINNYTYVDEIPSDDDTSYVESDTPGDIDLYNVTSPAIDLSEQIINGVYPEMRVKVTTTGDDEIRMLIKAGSTVYESDAVSPGFIYELSKGTYYNTNPATGLPWTASDLTDIQVGIEIVEPT